MCLIVLNYNDWETTLSFLKFTNQIDYIEKIIVVDNKSTDDSFAKLRNEISNKIDVISTNENGGYAKGNNYGMFYALAHYNVEYFCICNPDVKFDNSFIKNLLESFNYLRKPGMVSGLALDSNLNESWSYWNLPKFSDCIRSNFHLLSSLKEKKKLPIFDNPQIVDVIPGSFFIIKASVIREIGFFDESTFLYYEENILASKLKANGYFNYLITSEKYIHNHSVSINKNIKSLKSKMRIAHKSHKVYCKKCLKIGKFKMALFDVTYYIGEFNFLLLKRLKRTRTNM